MHHKDRKFRAVRRKGGEAWAYSHSFRHRYYRCKGCERPIPPGQLYTDDTPAASHPLCEYCEPFDRKPEVDPRQLSLLGAPHFDGPTYDPELDHVRLTGQLADVKEAMGTEGRWLTMSEIQRRSGHTAPGQASSISSKVRDLRKPKFGSHVVESRRLDGGLWEYRLLLPGHPEYWPEARRLV